MCIYLAGFGKQQTPSAQAISVGLTQRNVASTMGQPTSTPGFSQFGASTANAGGGLFGTPGATSGGTAFGGIFGTPNNNNTNTTTAATTTTFTGFGQQQPQTGIFGATTTGTTSTGLFGGQQQQQQQQPGSMFGGIGAKPFGMNATTPAPTLTTGFGGGMFGQRPAATVGGFGSSFSQQPFQMTAPQQQAVVPQSQLDPSSPLVMLETIVNAYLPASPNCVFKVNN